MAPIIRTPAGGKLEPADIGVTVQGYDSDLAAIAALSTTGLANRTGAGTWTTDSTSYLSTSAAASTYQPLDSDLTAIAALSTTASGRALLTISQAITVNNSAPNSPAAGDLWYNPNTGILGFWRSPYWLTAQTYHTADRAAASSTVDVATTPGLMYANPGAGAELVFVESCWVYRIPGGLNINSGDGSNYTTLKWGYHNANGTSYASIHEKNSNTINNTSRYRFDVNGAYTVTGFSMQRAIVGTVDITTSVRMGVTYRVIL